ncbi:MAG: hypothetical protein JWN34_3703 [Bryobacterales bacterium]|nr:hypothetical protein [Bryobacterales bacterium]
MKSQIITWVIAIVCSSAAGALGTQWYLNRSTVIRFSTTKSLVGGDGAASTVPNFRMQVGDQAIRSLYINTYRLQHASGPEVENAKIGFRLRGAKPLGKTITREPGTALPFHCDEMSIIGPDSTSFLCTARRFNSNVGVYEVTFATDADVKVDLSIDAKNSQLEYREETGGKNSEYDMLMVLLGMPLGMASTYIVIRSLLKNLAARS